MRILKIATSYQSLVTILAPKLAFLAAQPDIELYVMSSAPEANDVRTHSGIFLPISIRRSINVVKDFFACIQIWLVCKKYKFDIVHTHTAKAGFIGTVASHLAGIPVIMHTYHGLSYYPEQKKWIYHYFRVLEEWANSYRTLVFSQTQAETILLQKTPAITCMVVYEGNAVVVDSICKEAAALSANNIHKPFFKTNSLKVLCISRLEHVKQPFEILAAIVMLKEKNIEVELVFAGKGYLEKSLIHKIHRLKLDACVSCVYTPHIYRLMQESDLVLLFSQKEGIPRSIMEAMALKKPIIASDVCGTNELVLHGETGMLVNSKSVTGLADAIDQMIKNPMACKEMGEKGYARVCSTFGNEQGIVDIWKKAYASYMPVLAPKNSKNPPTILVVTTVAYTAEAFLLPYFTTLEAMGFEVVSVANWTKRWNRMSPFIKRLHIPFSRKFFSVMNLIALIKLFRALKSKNIAGIYTHTPIASALVRSAKMISRKKIPCIYEVHGQHFHENQNRLIHMLFKKAETFLAPHSETIITINKDDFAVAKTTYQHSTVEYVSGIGIDTKKYVRNETHGASLKESLGIANNIPVIATIGELIPRKRMDCVLATAKKLRNKKLDFVWVVAGVGPLQKQLVNEALRLDLGRHVIFMGFCNDISSLLSASSVFVLLSMHEGLPRSLLEAGALGVPSVVSDIRGNRDVVDHGINSFMVNKQNCDQAAEYIHTLLTDPSLATKMGTVLKSRIKNEFSLDVTLAQHEAIFKRVFGMGRGEST